MALTVWAGVGALAPGASAATLRPGQVAVVSDPGIALHVPADGRLGGDGFALDVSGYRFAYQLGFGNGAKTAPPGDALLVFGLSGSGTVPQADLLVDGLAEALPHGTGRGGGPVYYVAAVPASAREVALSASADGFTQTFSFTKGHRVGPRPEVLYRSPGSWRLVYHSTRGITSVATPDNNPVDDVPGSVLNVDLSSTTLTYFLPGTAATPAGPGAAWLVLSGSALPAGGAGGRILQFRQRLAPADITLTLPGGKPMPASLTGQGGPDDESSSYGLLGGDYYWQVPADMTTATVRMQLPSHLLAGAGYYGDHFGTVHEVPVEGTVPPLVVSFPAPSSPAPVSGPNPPPWAPRPSLSNTAPGAGKTAAATAQRGSGGGGPLGIVVALVIVVGAAAGGALAWRRRRVGRGSASAGQVTVDMASWLGGQGTGLAGAASPPAQVDGVAGRAPVSHVPVAPGPVTEETLTARDVATPGALPTGTVMTVAKSVLVPVPECPVPPPEGEIEVVTFGPIAVTGLPAGAPALTGSALELLAFLAVHEGRAFTSDTLRGRISAGRANEWSARTLSSYMYRMRQALGPERVPDATSGGYRLIGVRTDAARFDELVAKAKAEPDAAPAYLAAALSLVRGEPFAGATKGYGWEDAIKARMSNGVLAAALQLASLALEASDGELAAWAAGKGLLLWPTSSELAKFAMQAAYLTGGPAGLDQAWNLVSANYKEGAEPVTEGLVTHYEQLRRPPSSS